MRFRSLLMGALLALVPLATYAVGQIGGSAFPLTYATIPVNNPTQGYNETLLIMNTQTTPLADPDFGNSLTQNPRDKRYFVSFTAAQVSAGVNILNSASGYTIFPGVGHIMVSGSASGASNVVVECYPSAAVITTIPASALLDNRPITFTYTSSAATASAIPQKALVAGCSAADAIMISAPGLATTTQVFINLPYVVQQ